MIEPITTLLQITEAKVLRDDGAVLVKAEGFYPYEPESGWPLSVHWQVFVGGKIPTVGAYVRVRIEDGGPIDTSESQPPQPNF